MTKIDTSLKAEIFVVTGSSGSGKSSIVKKRLARHKRAIIFDPDDEYGKEKGVCTATSVSDLVDKIEATKGGAMKIRIVARTPQAFGAVCNIAFAWGNCLFIAEELAGENRTTPSKAPPDWHKIVSRGRKRGITVIGVTQRIAESDKTIIGNASHIFAGRMTRSADRKLIAREIDLPDFTLAGLRDLQFIVADMRSHERFKLDVKTGQKQKI